MKVILFIILYIIGILLTYAIFVKFTNVEDDTITMFVSVFWITLPFIFIVIFLSSIIIKFFEKYREWLLK